MWLSQKSLALSSLQEKTVQLRSSKPAVDLRICMVPYFILTVDTSIIHMIKKIEGVRELISCDLLG